MIAKATPHQDRSQRSISSATPGIPGRMHEQIATLRGVVAKFPTEALGSGRGTGAFQDWKQIVKTSDSIPIARRLPAWRSESRSSKKRWLPGCQAEQVNS